MMNRSGCRVALVAMACALYATIGYAAPITADFSSEHGFYTSSMSPFSCRTLSATGRAIGSGAELGLGDSTLTGCIGALGVDWNPSTGLLTVSGLEGVTAGNIGANYAFIGLSISNILFDVIGEQISSVALVSQNLFTGIDNVTRFNPAPLISFGANAIDIDWAVLAGNNSANMSVLLGGTATFQIGTAIPVGVPEPTSLLLVGTGLAIAALHRRRQTYP